VETCSQEEIDLVYQEVEIGYAEARDAHRILRGDNLRVVDPVPVPVLGTDNPERALARLEDVGDMTGIKNYIVWNQLNLPLELKWVIFEN
jgi:hypothetical protein